jgi:hypothetical protein
MQQQMTMQPTLQHTVHYLWFDGFDTEGLGRKLWKLSWGLLFVMAMTLLSEFGPRTEFSKIPPAPVVAKQPAVHAVK